MTLERFLHFASVDGAALLAATLSALVCGMLGNWLVLRRTSLMGDAISHSVLPGIVGAFLVTGTRAPVPMFVGAIIAALLTVAVTQAVRRLARVDMGAAMGVTFASFFAFGVLLIEQASARQVDLDPDCVLYGSLETLFWFPPANPRDWLSLSTLALLPTPVKTLLVVTVVSAIVLRLLRKELALASFDAPLAAALGFRPALLGAILMTLTAAATIASFEAVGSILVVAMLVCPAAAARLWTDRLRTQTRLSAAFAVLSAILGYLLAATAPRWLGTTHALGAAGTMATTAGAILTISIVAGPTHGLVARVLRRRELALRVAREDALGALFRMLESGTDRASEQLLVAAVGPRGIAEARRRGEIETANGLVRLTPTGVAEAQAIIRSHRLWETYLVEEAGLAADHVHESAERLEHVREVAPEVPRALDPQGKPIPKPTS
ncbi:MAG: metal ABC transporter permease [Phycisphaerae bacterium]|nr:metal ABC transporter permease [Phycisphaerae bacterium]